MSFIDRPASSCKSLPLPEFLLEVVEDDEADGDPGQAAGDVGQVGEGRGGGGRVLGVKPPVHSHTHLQRERYRVATWIMCAQHLLKHPSTKPFENYLY